MNSGPVLSLCEMRDYIAFMMFSLLILAGCFGGEDLPTDKESRDPMVMLEQCQSIECKSQWGVLAWRKDFQLGAEIMTQLSSLEQQVIMQEILSEQPTWLPRVFCESVSDKAVEESCWRLMSRPHLWAVTKKSLSLLTVSDQSFQFAPHSEYCGTVGCWQTNAEAKVEQGEFDEAGNLCASETVKTLREECFFKIAEAASLRVEQSMQYCYLAETYRSNCYEHLIEAYSKLIALQDDSWESLRDTSEQLNLFWQPLDPEFGTVLQSRLWGEIIRLKIEGATSIGSDLFLKVPEAQQIHLSTAVIHYLIRERPTVTVERVLEQLEEVKIGQRKVKVNGTLPNRVFRLRFMPELTYQYILGKSIRPVFSPENQSIGAIAEALYLEYKLSPESFKEIPCDGELAPLCRELSPFVQSSNQGR